MGSSLFEQGRGDVHRQTACATDLMPHGGVFASNAIVISMFLDEYIYCGRDSLAVCMSDIDPG